MNSVTHEKGMARLMNVPLVQRLLKDIVSEANQELEYECCQAKEQLKAAQKAVVISEKDFRRSESERQTLQARTDEQATEMRRLQDAHTSELRELKVRHGKEKQSQCEELVRCRQDGTSAKCTLE